MKEVAGHSQSHRERERTLHNIIILSQTLHQNCVYRRLLVLVSWEDIKKVLARSRRCLTPRPWSMASTSPLRRSCRWTTTRALGRWPSKLDKVFWENRTYTTGPTGAGRPREWSWSVYGAWSCRRNGFSEDGQSRGLAQRQEHPDKGHLRAAMLSK